MVLPKSSRNAWNCMELPGVSRSYFAWPGVAWSCMKLPLKFSKIVELPGYNPEAML